MSILAKFKTSKEAKEADWFSRRHKTNKELLESRELRKIKHEYQMGGTTKATNSIKKQG